MVQVLRAIASELRVLPNKLAVEGHTDSQPFGGRDGYGNWELSADRANAARRILEASGLDPTQVEAVRGFADTRLRTPDAPLDAGNRLGREGIGEAEAPVLVQGLARLALGLGRTGVVAPGRCRALRSKFIENGGKRGGSGGDVLRAMVELQRLDPTRGHASASGASLVEQQRCHPGSRQPARAGEARDSCANDHHGNQQEDDPPSL